MRKKRHGQARAQGVEARERVQGLLFVGVCCGEMRENAAHAKVRERKHAQHGAVVLGQPQAAHAAVDLDMHRHANARFPRRAGKCLGVRERERSERDLCPGECCNFGERRIAKEQYSGKRCEFSHLKGFLNACHGEEIAPRAQQRRHGERKAVAVGIRLHDGDRAPARARYGAEIMKQRVCIDLGNGARPHKAGICHSDLFSVIIPQFLSFGKPLHAYFRNIFHILKQITQKGVSP